MPDAIYTPRRAAESESVDVRGLRLHVNRWRGRADRPLLVMVHGWMDVGASFQFVVDALGDDRAVVAPDWRGFGRSDTPQADCYWFPDYMADLDALLDHWSPGAPVDLAGHSMGGNVAMLYAGVRPGRVRRLVNLEGFGMPATQPDEAPTRYARWLDELRQPARLSRYDSLDAVARRLMQNNPLLRADRAAWLAPHWAERGADGRYDIRADAAHKRANPVLSRSDETLAIWRAIAAPVAWIDGDRTDIAKWWGGRYSRDEFDARLAVVPDVRRHRVAPAGHMLHHDQPEAVAAIIAGFIDG